MRVGCFHGWVFLLGFARPIQIALVDSFFRRALSPAAGSC